MSHLLFNKFWCYQPGIKSQCFLLMVNSKSFRSVFTCILDLIFLKMKLRRLRYVYKTFLLNNVLYTFYNKTGLK